MSSFDWSWNEECLDSNLTTALRQVASLQTQVEQATIEWGAIRSYFRRRDEELINKIREHEKNIENLSLKIEELLERIEVAKACLSSDNVSNPTENQGISSQSISELAAHSSSTEPPATWN